MDIKVSGRKTTVTDALRAHVDEKIGEACKVFDIEPMTVDVVLRYEKTLQNPIPPSSKLPFALAVPSFALPSTVQICMPLSIWQLIR